MNREAIKILNSSRLKKEKEINDNINTIKVLSESVLKKIEDLQKEGRVISDSLSMSVLYDNKNIKEIKTVETLFCPTCKNEVYHESLVEINNEMICLNCLMKKSSESYYKEYGRKEDLSVGVINSWHSEDLRLISPSHQQSLGNFSISNNYAKINTNPKF
ncbi:MAG: hypothetical protein ACRCW9_06310 [Cetobacterium sp.]